MTYCDRIRMHFCFLAGIPVFFGVYYLLNDNQWHFAKMIGFLDVVSMLLMITHALWTFTFVSVRSNAVMVFVILIELGLMGCSIFALVDVSLHKENVKKGVDIMMFVVYMGQACDIVAKTLVYPLLEQQQTTPENRV